MCGLWASVGLDVPRAAIEVVAHRGPEGEGWGEGRSDIGRRVVLAHRRWAILDLHERAAQPMLHGPSGCRIVYNGEVYNFKELRRELEAKGHEFHTASDTEVVLAAYAEWGEDCLARFNGMFAFVIPDPIRTLFFPHRFATSARDAARGHRMRAGRSLAFRRDAGDGGAVPRAAALVRAQA